MVTSINNNSNTVNATVTVVAVPTKTYDGGSQRRMILKEAEEAAVQDAQDSKQRDPFMFYSNDANRFAYLLHRDVEPPQQQQMSVVRKTRISFEIYPDLLFDDILINVNADATAGIAQEEANQ
jgi:hypothetical protein